MVYRYSPSSAHLLQLWWGYGERKRNKQIVDQLKIGKFVWKELTLTPFTTRKSHTYIWFSSGIFITKNHVWLIKFGNVLSNLCSEQLYLNYIYIYIVYSLKHKYLHCIFFWFCIYFSPTYQWITLKIYIGFIIYFVKLVLKAIILKQLQLIWIFRSWYKFYVKRITIHKFF